MYSLENVTSTFRRRTMARIQNPATSSTSCKATSVNRWAIYKQLCVAKSVFGLNDRCLAVLSALLSFYPENDISAKTGLVVFPSNRQLSLRAHGMPESTLRRHLASLIDVGVIARRDSPNGKRYAYKTETGAVEEAFGFSFAPLLTRAKEIEAAAEKTQAETKLLKRTRERLTLQRRELAQLYDATPPEVDPKFRETSYQQFRAIVNGIPRRASIAELNDILGNLTALYADITNHMNSLNDATELSDNHAQNERHYNESHSESFYEDQKEQFIDLKEPEQKLSHSDSGLSLANNTNQHSSLSLDMVLRTCPDIRDYASGHVSSWRDLSDASRIVAKFLGIAQSAYHDAAALMGQENTSAIIAWILQRNAKIRSAGGYLRFLTQQAQSGRLSIYRLLMSDPDQVMHSRS